MRDSLAHLERRFCSNQRQPGSGGCFILVFIPAFGEGGLPRVRQVQGREGAHLPPPAADLWQDVV